MAINFSNLRKNINLYHQEFHSTPNKIKPKEITWRHIITTLHKAKAKEKRLNAAREK